MFCKAPACYPQALDQASVEPCGPLATLLCSQTVAVVIAYMLTLFGDTPQVQDEGSTLPKDRIACPCGVPT